jgi:hypothetical protein
MDPESAWERIQDKLDPESAGEWDPPDEVEWDNELLGGGPHWQTPWEVA